MSLELRLAEIRLRSLAEALSNLPGLTPADRQCIVESFQRALRKLRERQALEQQEHRLKNVQRFFVGRHHEAALGLVKASFAGGG